MISFAKIPAGSFVMEAYGRANVTKCEFTHTKPFLMATHLVSQKLWQSIMSTSPWKLATDQCGRRVGLREGENFPAVGMTWAEAMECAARFSAIEKKKVSLPTEAQWEYAIRAGTTTRYFWGEDYSRVNEYAWVGSASLPPDSFYLHEIGTLKPNPWGLYDMAGNVREWVRDRCEISRRSPDVAEGHYPKTARDWFCPKGSMAIVRNASYCSSSIAASSYYNKVVNPDERSIEYGFRCMMEEE